MKRGQAARGLVPALGVLVACAAWAPWPALAQNANDGATVDVRTTEVELSVTGGPELFSMTSVTVGLLERLQLAVGAAADVNGLRVPSGRDGWDHGQADQVLSEGAISSKLLLREGSLQERPGASVAAELAMLFPEEHGLGAALTVILSHSTDALTLHLNGTATWPHRERMSVGGLVGVEGPSHWTVRPVLEVVLDTQLGSPPTAVGLLGVAADVSELVAVSAALAFSPPLSGDADGEMHGQVVFTWSEDASRRAQVPVRL